MTGPGGSPRGETEATPHAAAARHTLGPCTERALSGRHDVVRGRIRRRAVPTRGAPVTEAVIVATARTPIGRAFKGSLKDMRPDDLSEQVVRGLLEKVPALDPETIDDLYWGCADPSGAHGSNLARVIAVLAGMDHLPAATSTGSAPARPRPCGWPSTRSRPARATPSSSAASSASRSTPASPGPAAATPRPRTPGSRMPRRAAPRWPAPTRRGPTRARTGLLPDVYLAMGQTAENVATSRGVSRQRQDEWGVTEPEPRREGHRRRVLRPRDPAGHAGRRHRGRRATTARAPA